LSTFISIKFNAHALYISGNSASMVTTDIHFQFVNRKLEL
jgi:hypothetical protein